MYENCILLLFALMGVLLEGGEKAKEGKDGFTRWDLEELPGFKSTLLKGVLHVQFELWSWDDQIDLCLLAKISREISNLHSDTTMMK